MNNIAFTIVAKNYFASARTLAKSMAESNPECKFYIVLADRTSNEIEVYKDSTYDLLLAENLNIPRFLEMSFKYDVTEFATAIKPFCIEHFQNIEGTKSVLYIDPDIYVYESLENIFEVLNKYSAVVTPHILTTGNSSYDIESSFLFSGTYNLGFFGVSSNLNGRILVNWWKERLTDYAFVDYVSGLYTDQKWMNLVTTEFDDVYVMRDYEYNVAWWNFKERCIVEVNGKPYVIQNGEKKPVVFFHFSGFKAGNRESISKSKSFKALENANHITTIFEKYESFLMENEYEKLSALPYSFLTYDNGIVITRFQRRIYRTLLEENNGVINRCKNPFDTTEGSLYKLFKKNGLIVNSKNTAVAFANRNNMAGFSRKENAIQKMLLIIKKILGIQRYEVLIRYLSHALEAEKQTFLIRKW